MRDKWEDMVFDMADKEQMMIPQTLSNRIEDTLCKLKIDESAGREDVIRHGQNVAKSRKNTSKHRKKRRKSLLLVAVLTMLASATAMASVGAVRERMEAMNRQKMESYFTQIYTTKVGHDNYNRPYTETEKERLNALKDAYEKEAHFPEGELTMLDSVEDYKGRGVAFFGGTTTFFFPEKEMSDEQLLRIIDFMHKRDYSLAKMNEMIAAGETQMPETGQEEAEATDEEILASDAVYEPGRRLVIPYTGELELDYTVAAGKEGLFLAGWNSVHKMEIGSSDSELFFDDFGTDTRILSMCQDADGNVYMALWQWEDGESGTEQTKLAVWVVDREGKLVQKIDLSPYLQQERQGYIRRMAVDGEGYLYLKTAGLKSIQDGAECEILVLDKEGAYVNSISGGEYALDILGGLGVGKDGKVYTQIGNYYEPDKPTNRLGIASVDIEKGKLGDIYYDIVPEGTIMLDIVAPGAETDFVLWGYDGIFTYNLGDESAVNVLPAYEAPCDWEGARVCALPDGRIVFAVCTEYRVEETAQGHRLYGIPEKTCFYYEPGMQTGQK